MIPRRSRGCDRVVWRSDHNISYKYLDFLIINVAGVPLRPGGGGRWGWVGMEMESRREVRNRGGAAVEFDGSGHEGGRRRGRCGGRGWRRPTRGCLWARREPPCPARLSTMNRVWTVRPIRQGGPSVPKVAPPPPSSAWTPQAACSRAWSRTSASNCSRARARTSRIAARSPAVTAGPVIITR